MVDFDPGAGTFNLTSVGNYDVFILRLDNSGNFIWAGKIGVLGLDNGFSIAVDASGNIYTCGLFMGAVDFDPGPNVFNIASAGIQDIFVLKLNSSGDFVWAKAMGGVAQDEGRALALDALGNVYITGIFNSTADFGPSSATYTLTDVTGGNIFLCKLDASGNFEWAVESGGHAADIGTSVALNTAGNLYVTGFFFSHSLTVTSPLLNADTSALTNDIVIAKTSTIPTGNGELENYSYTISISPNPVRNELVVSSSEFGDQTELTIYNILGKVIYTKHLSSDFGRLTISVADFPSGIYFVRVKSSER